MVEVIAEVGSVHDGSFGNAIRLVDLAAACGVDTVKFQTHLAEAESLPGAPSPAFFSAEDRIEYFRRTAFTAAQWGELRAYATEVGVQFLSTAFSPEAVDILESIEVDRHKVASGEVSNIPMLERLAEIGKPVLLSSGMSDWEELDAALAALDGCDVTVLQCTSAYPCPPERAGLNVISEIQRRYDKPAGFSDHTEGTAAAVAAVAFGAVVIEKHLTFSRAMYGSDAPYATEPAEFARLVSDIREVEAMLLAPVDKDDLALLQEMKRVFEKSVVTARPLPAGTLVSRGDIRFKKPGTGIRAARYRSVIGRAVVRDLPPDHLLSEADLR